MFSVAIYAMVYLGSALMVYNIYRFVRFTRYVRSHVTLERERLVLVTPTVLLVCFLLGYLGIGLFSDPDLLVASILFGGSIFVFLACLLLDRVTQSVVAHERVEADLRAAEAANQAKTSFLSSVSHEMRTPMNVIMGTSDLVLREDEISERARGRVTKVALAARHLLGLINNILDLNDTADAKLAVASEPFSLTGALEQVCAIATTLAEDKGLAFETALEGRPARAYLGDEIRIKQALLCMLDNAVKYTDAPGTVSLSVHVQDSDDACHQVSLIVSDTGIGMDGAFLGRVFQTFSQEDATMTSRFGGSGLSLAVVKRYLNAMGAEVTVASEKGVGSTFTILLPLAVHDSAPAEDEPGAEAASLEGLRALVVEDIDDNAEIICDLLDLEGIESERAENGSIAVDMVAAAPERHYDCVLMDLRMPVMDGFEATRAIRALPRADVRALPIIALTANTSAHDRALATESGMNAHLAKPTDVDELFDTIRHLCCPPDRRLGG